MKCAVVIAAYNEQENLAELTSKIIRTLSHCPDLQWQLIYVIEGADLSYAIAQSFAKKHPEITILYREQPQGLGAAFRCGFAAVQADTDLVITMDADLNHQPEEMPRLMEAALRRKVDIVIGSRKQQQSKVDGAPFWKTSLSNAVNQVIRLAIGMPIADQTSGYRVYRYEALRKIAFENSGFAFLPEILLRAHAIRLKMVEEPIHFVYRTKGESKMRLGPTAKSYLTMLGSRLRGWK